MGAQNSDSDEAIFYDALNKELELDPTQITTEPTLKNPDLDIAQLKFKLRLPEFANDVSKTKKLLHYIKQNLMAPYYEVVCDDLKWKVDKSLLNEMKEANANALESLEAEIEYAIKNLGAIDIKEAYLNKANYLSKIGDKENTLKTLEQAYANTVALGYKLDNVFHCIRIGLFFNDLELIRKSLDKCEDLIEEGADWHYRNCFKIYKGLFSIGTRDFSTACEVFTSSIATFVCTELITFNQFIKYTIISATIDLDRRNLKKKIMSNADVLQALHYNPTLKDFVFSLYNGEYKDFFHLLGEVETDMKQDMLLHPHYRFYVREMKIKAYNQLLSTYISLNISYMAEQFGVTEEYIEDDISKFIAAKRLNYKIDKVSGKIINIHGNRRAEMFENVTKHGDLLLNRIHKLSRIINI